MNAFELWCQENDYAPSTTKRVGYLAGLKQAKEIAKDSENCSGEDGCFVAAAIDKAIREIEHG